MFVFWLRTKINQGIGKSLSTISLGIERFSKAHLPLLVDEQKRTTKLKFGGRYLVLYSGYLLDKASLYVVHNRTKLFQ